jgi:hypothetical protein
MVPKGVEQANSELSYRVEQLVLELESDKYPVRTLQLPQNCSTVSRTICSLARGNGLADEMEMDIDVLGTTMESGILG